ncbi:MAG TPA: SUMF1/EgtB/PvdO family nonheme iron enzyme [Myxococcota bacterium]|nr:SUMF1/EgtB/PvdO family nonheme iron enzyme [Myxococcota bacterium]
MGNDAHLVSPKAPYRAQPGPASSIDLGPGPASFGTPDPAGDTAGAASDAPSIQRLDAALAAHAAERRRTVIDTLAETLGLPGGRNPHVLRAELTLRRAGATLRDADLVEAGRYMVGPEIGRGGMGRVHLAVDCDLGRTVALKTLHPGGKKSREVLARFLEEAQATGQLEHPNIVPVHDLGLFSDGTVYFTMKLVRGRTLHQIIRLLAAGDHRTRAEFGRVRLLSVFQQVCLGVAFAHSRGVLHRDLKPANIMLGAYGEVQVMDWGLAKIGGAIGNDETAGDGAGDGAGAGGGAGAGAGASDSIDVDAETPAPRRYVPDTLDERVQSVFGGVEWADGDLPVSTVREVLADQRTIAGKIFGTPQYMSPEQAVGRGDKVDERSDVYSLGAILYEILTYRAPVEGETALQVLEATRTGEIVPPRRRAPENAIPPELEEICLRALAKRRRDRYPRARALADDVEQFLEGRKEQERREREAAERHGGGEAELTRFQAHVTRAQELRGEIHALAATIKPFEPPARKRPLWALERALGDEEVGAAESFGRAVDFFSQAVAAVPDHGAARARLAELFLARFEDAEDRRAQTDAAYYRKLVERYDDGRWAARLRGDGALTLDSEPRGAEVVSARLEEVDRVLVARPRGALGRTPLREVPLPMGSWVLTLRAPGCRDTVVPLRIARGARPALRVPLYAEAEVGAELAYVPEGPFAAGGDPAAPGAWARHQRRVAGVFVAVFPVTAAEYLEFVNDLAARNEAAAHARLPRVNPQSGQYWTRGASGRYELLDTDGEVWDPRWPVVGVSFEDAQAYCAWRGVRDGRVYRLPTDEEWEKAARGVDGRLYPWGDHFDPTFCKMRASRDGAPRPEPVGSFAVDCSPYGVRDLAGGVREWCDDWFDDGRTLRVTRGGGFFSAENSCRACHRFGARPSSVNTDLGFRLARTPPRE